MPNSIVSDNLYIRIGNWINILKVVVLKKNCWEFTGCGKEPGGPNVEHEGECPTASRVSMNGINHGMNGGRYCWRVPSTLCPAHGGSIVPNWADKMKRCLVCDFFNLVREEEEGYLKI